MLTLACEALCVPPDVTPLGSATIWPTSVPCCSALRVSPPSTPSQVGIMRRLQGSPHVINIYDSLETSLPLDEVRRARVTHIIAP